MKPKARLVRRLELDILRYSGWSRDDRKKRAAKVVARELIKRVKR